MGARRHQTSRHDRNSLFKMPDDRKVPIHSESISHRKTSFQKYPGYKLLKDDSEHAEDQNVCTVAKDAATARRCDNSGFTQLV